MRKFKWKGPEVTIFVFGGSKENPNWYYTECRLVLRPIMGWDNEAKRPYCNFIATHKYHSGGYYIISLKQLVMLHFKQRLFFNEKHAKAKRSKNYIEKTEKE